MPSREEVAMSELLSTDNVRQFWHEYQDSMIYRVVSFMEATENWTLDGDPAVENAVSRLSDALTNIDNLDLGNEDAIIAIANNLKSGRALRLLHVIDSARPGAASKILIHAEESSKAEGDVYSLFLRRNIVFERLRLLARIFDQSRFQVISKALEGEDHE